MFDSFPAKPNLRRLVILLQSVWEIMQQIQMVEEAVRCLAARAGSGFLPRAAITLGTGLSDLSSEIKVLSQIPYGEIPHFPLSTVPSHAGELVLGHLAGRPVAALAGRFHLYEGYTPQEVTFPVRVLAEWGVGTFVFSNAAGGLDLTMRPGQVMLIADHLNLTLENPLIGPNHDAWGERFPDMSRVYDAELRALARQVAREAGIGLREGVYAGLKGPSMETPAETRMLRVLGADAVGMSTVLEVIAARHHGKRVLAFSAISNVNDPADMQPAPLELVIKNAGQAGHDLGRLIAGVVARL